MKMDSIEQVRTIASGIFNMLLQDESHASPPESIDDWDSMQRLSLVLALEEHFSLEFAPEEIEGMKTLADVAVMVGRKQGDGPGER